MATLLFHTHTHTHRANAFRFIRHPSATRLAALCEMRGRPDVAGRGIEKGKVRTFRSRSSDRVSTDEPMDCIPITAHHTDDLLKLSIFSFTPTQNRHLLEGGQAIDGSGRFVANLEGKLNSSARQRVAVCLQHLALDWIGAGAGTFAHSFVDFHGFSECAKGQRTKHGAPILSAISRRPAGLPPDCIFIANKERKNLQVAGVFGERERSDRHGKVISCDGKHPLFLFCFVAKVYMS